MNLFLILTRSSNAYTYLLSSYLRKNRVETVQVVDSLNAGLSDGYCVGFPDKELIDKNFIFLDPTNKSPNAWDKLIYYIKDLQQYDYFYIMEDDVYCSDFSVFLDVVKEMNFRNEDLISGKIILRGKRPLWYHWYALDILSVKYKIKYNTHVSSFNPFCRISRKLLNKIVQFYKENRYFYFHEVMFPTICFNSGMSFLDYSRDKRLNNFFGYFHHKELNKPIFDSNKIVHPVKFHLGKIIKLNIK